MQAIAISRVPQDASISFTLSLAWSQLMCIPQWANNDDDDASTHFANTNIQYTQLHSHRAATIRVPHTQNPTTTTTQKDNDIDDVNYTQLNDAR